MSNDHNNTDALEESAIYRLRWVANAMEAAKRYAQEHPEEVRLADPDLMDSPD